MATHPETQESAIEELLELDEGWTVALYKNDRMKPDAATSIKRGAIDIEVMLEVLPNNALEVVAKVDGPTPNGIDLHIPPATIDALYVFHGRWQERQKGKKS